MFAAYSAYFATLNVFTLLLLFILGILILTAGSLVLLLGGQQLARIFRVKEHIIGLTVIALSTSMPEFFVSMNAVASGYGYLSVANVIGSNIFNTLFLYGLFLLLIMEPSNISKGSLYFVLGLYLLLFLFAAIPQLHPTRFWGVVFLVMFIPYFWILFKSEKNQQVYSESPTDLAPSAEQSPATSTELPAKERQGAQDIQGAQSAQGTRDISVQPSASPQNPFSYFMERASYKVKVLLSLLCIVVGSFLLYAGSDIFLLSSIELVTRMGGSERLLGLFVVSVGTGLPEFFVLMVAVIVSLFQKIVRGKESSFKNLGEGNIIGSNIINLMLIIGVVDIVSPINFLSRFKGDIIFLGAVSLILLLLFLRKILIQRVVGISFLALYFFYLFVLL